MSELQPPTKAQRTDGFTRSVIIEYRDKDGNILASRVRNEISIERRVWSKKTLCLLHAVLKDFKDEPPHE